MEKELEIFIKKAIENKVPEKEILQALKQSGWNDLDIKEASERMDLLLFVKKAKEGNLSNRKIKESLKKTGWSDEEINSVLGKWYSNIHFGISGNFILGVLKFIFLIAIIALVILVGYFGFSHLGSFANLFNTGTGIVPNQTAFIQSIEDYKLNLTINCGFSSATLSGKIIGDSEDFSDTKISANAGTLTINEIDALGNYKITINCVNEAVISFNKPGFVPLHKKISLVTGVNELDVMLKTETPFQTLSTDKGNSIEQDGVKMNIAANSIIDPSTGKVSETAKISVTAFDATSQEDMYFFPGDFEGISLGGDIGGLESYGFFKIKVEDVNNKSLELAPNASIPTILPIAELQEASAPSSIPLWHFNETLGIWVQIGDAKKQCSAGVCSYDFNLPKIGSSFNVDVFTPPTQKLNIDGVDIKKPEKDNKTDCRDKALEDFMKENPEFKKLYDNVAKFEKDFRSRNGYTPNALDFFRTWVSEPTGRGYNLNALNSLAFDLGNYESVRKDYSGPFIQTFNSKTEGLDYKEFHAPNGVTINLDHLAVGAISGYTVPSAAIQNIVDFGNNALGQAFTVYFGVYQGGRSQKMGIPFLKSAEGVGIQKLNPQNYYGNMYGQSFGDTKYSWKDMSPTKFLEENFRKAICWEKKDLPTSGDPLKIGKLFHYNFNPTLETLGDLYDLSAEKIGASFFELIGLSGEVILDSSIGKESSVSLGVDLISGKIHYSLNDYVFLTNLPIFKELLAGGLVTYSSVIYSQNEDYYLLDGSGTSMLLNSSNLDISGEGIRAGDSVNFAEFYQKSGSNYFITRAQFMINNEPIIYEFSYVDDKLTSVKNNKGQDISFKYSGNKLEIVEDNSLGEKKLIQEFIYNGEALSQVLFKNENSKLAETNITWTNKKLIIKDSFSSTSYNFNDRVNSLEFSNGNNTQIVNLVYTGDYTYIKSGSSTINCYKGICNIDELMNQLTTSPKCTDNNPPQSYIPSANDKISLNAQGQLASGGVIAQEQKIQPDQLQNSRSLTLPANSNLDIFIDLNGVPSAPVSVKTGSSGTVDISSFMKKPANCNNAQVSFGGFSFDNCKMYSSNLDKLQKCILGSRTMFEISESEAMNLMAEISSSKNTKSSVYSFIAREFNYFDACYSSIENNVYTGVTCIKTQDPFKEMGDSKMVEKISSLDMTNLEKAFVLRALAIYYKNKLFCEAITLESAKQSCLNVLGGLPPVIPPTNGTGPGTNTTNTTLPPTNTTIPEVSQYIIDIYLRLNATGRTFVGNTIGSFSLLETYPNNTIKTILKTPSNFSWIIPTSPFTNMTRSYRYEPGRYGGAGYSCAGYDSVGPSKPSYRSEGDAHSYSSYFGSGTVLAAIDENKTLVTSIKSTKGICDYESISYGYGCYPGYCWNDYATITWPFNPGTVKGAIVDDSTGNLWMEINSKLLEFSMDSNDADLPISETKISDILANLAKK